MDTETPTPLGGRPAGGRAYSAHQRAQSGYSLRLAGAGLLIAAGAIHLDLYLTGYRSIPVIGGLFLAQVIAAFGMGVLVLVRPGRLLAAGGALFALSTLGGYLLSLWLGLFGFTEVRTTAGIVAGVVDVAAFAALACLAVLQPGRGRSGGLSAHLDGWLLGRRRGAAAVVSTLSVAALISLGVSVATAAIPAVVVAGGSLSTIHIRGVTVLATAGHRTLYSFAPDSPTRSACNGSCAAYWPPLTGPVVAGPGIPGILSTITRSDGTRQAAYNGQPLYTYIGDSGPGQANGNGLNLNGGLWQDISVPASSAHEPPGSK